MVRFRLALAAQAARLRALWSWRAPQWVKSVGWLVSGSLCIVPLGVAGGYLYLDPQVPAAETYLHYRPQAPMRVFSADGAFMAEFGERRFIPVALEAVPDHFKNALLDTEDKRFYDHGGIDYISLADDVISILLNPDVRTGASTITMQLARNVSFSLEQTFIRKFKEMLLAIKIEQELTKEQVLELYINVLFFGKRAYGAQAAAHTYYDKPLAELSLAQLAMLAGILKRPDAGNPINGPEWALERRNLVLRRMLAQGSIDRAAYEVARDAPITAQVHRREIELEAPYVAEWVRNELVRRYGAEVYGSGYAAYATVEAAHQRAATQALREGLLGYDRQHGYRGVEGHVALDAAPPSATDAAAGVVETPSAAPPWQAALAARSLVGGLVPMVVTDVAERAFTAVDATGERVTVEWDGMAWARRYIDQDRRGPRPRVAADILAQGDIVRVRRLPDGAWALAQVPDIQGALIALRPQDGAVLALAGGFDFWASQFNHALQASRQPGSGFKPFVYSAALDAGVTPATIIVDAPLVFEDPSFATPYRPRNDSGRYNGPTRLREALYRSINLVSIQVLQRVGIRQVLEHAQRFGFDTSSFPANTQLAIGGGTMSVTPRDMAGAYAVIANGGYAVTPHILLRVEGRDGETLLEPRYPVACDACELAGSAAAPAVSDVADASAIVPAPRAIDRRNAFILDSMLRDVIARGTGRRARALGRGDLGGKTGTTNEAADTWFNGYNAHLAASVWVGFDDYRPVGRREYGSTTPLTVWMDFMRVALDGMPDDTRPQPQGVVSVKIHPQQGCAANVGDPDAIFEYFLEEHPPAERCAAEDLSPERIF